MRAGHSLNIPNLKAQARRYRAVHEGLGKPISHSRALDLWEPIDPVASMKFGSLRKRISGNIGLDGKSVDRISNGAPVLAIEMRDEV